MMGTWKTDYTIIPAVGHQTSLETTICVLVSTGGGGRPSGETPHGLMALLGRTWSFVHSTKANSLKSLKSLDVFNVLMRAL